MKGDSHMAKKKEIRYLAGWEVDFHDEDFLRSYLAVHGVNKEGFNFFKEVQSAIELEIEGDTAVRVLNEYKEVIERNVPLPLPQWKDHQVFFLEKNTKGNHKLGGDIPGEFTLPTIESTNIKFHYIGTLDGKDPHFSWLGIDSLHIAYPLNDLNFGIYLDYSNPNKPLVLNPDTFNDDWHNPELETDEDITFTETHFKSTSQINIEKYLDGSDLILCGVPLWYQAPKVPICPKTNQTMKFVCSINSDHDIVANVNDDSREYLCFGNSLCFGDFGHLFIFWNPESRIMHVNIQF